MRPSVLAVPMLVLALLVAGCGGSSSAPGSSMTMPGGTVMKDSQMSTQGAGPSSSAREVCNGEIRAAVGRNLDVDHPAQGRPSWNRHQRLYTCTYRVGAGALRLSVKDVHRTSTGQAYYEDLMRRLPGATPIRGVLSFGFAAFETPSGDVVFIKDHKTLWVDPSGLAAADLPRQTSRQEIAYGVAASVIGCWTE